jgi:transcription antitermination protein NusB
MGQRRKSREIALQMLYQMEMTGQPPQVVIDLYSELALGDDDSKDPKLAKAVHPFAEQLLYGVHAHREELDGMIVAASENWRLERMSMIDRNVLRIALYEMLYRAEIPPKVSINEAIDLGKTFGSPDSGAFINGILDHLLPEVTRIREG